MLWFPVLEGKKITIKPAGLKGVFLKCFCHFLFFFLGGGGGGGGGKKDSFLQL